MSSRPCERYEGLNPRATNAGLTGTNNVKIQGIPDMTHMLSRRARNVFLTMILLCGPSLAAAASFRLNAEGNAQDFGFSVAPAGDVNGDDIPDLIVGAPSYDGIQDFAGRAYLFLGPFDGDRAAQDADAVISAVNFGDNLGFSVASAGDTNGDGFDDLLVGARSNDAQGIQAGQAYLFRGPIHGELQVSDATAVISGEEFDELGRTVAGVGDLNHDGFADIAVGAPLANGIAVSSGRVLVYYGPVSGPLTVADADAVIDGVTFNEMLGTSIAAAGDMNDDGTDDLVIGGPRPNLNGSGTGHAYVFYGPATGHHSATEADAILEGEALNDEFGMSVAGGHDVNGDGLDDLVIGASQFTGGRSGKAYVFNGPLQGFVSATNAAAVLPGESRESMFGSSVAMPGDVDGDGFADVLVGAQFDDSLAIHGGRGFLYFGPLAGTVEASQAIVLTGSFGNFVGASVAPAGDLDGDDRADLLVGASGFEDAGFAQVLHGADLVPQRIRVAVAPIGGPVQIPAGGGSFDFRVSLRNPSAQPQTIELWTGLVVPPARTPRTPVAGPVEITLPPGATVQRVLTQAVLGTFPAGTSTLVANIRRPVDTVGDLATLRFTKARASD